MSEEEEEEEEEEEREAFFLLLLLEKRRNQKSLVFDRDDELTNVLARMCFACSCCVVGVVVRKFPSLFFF
jgi:hypothetical protein